MRRRGRATDESIPSPRHGLDVARTPRVVAERRPKLADRGFQHRVADVPVSPHGIEQRTLRDQRSGLTHQRAQEREWRRCNREWLPIAQQARIDLVQLERIEANVDGGARIGSVRRLRCLPRCNAEASGCCVRLAADVVDWLRDPSARALGLRSAGERAPLSSVIAHVLVAHRSGAEDSAPSATSSTPRCTRQRHTDSLFECRSATAVPTTATGPDHSAPTRNPSQSATRIETSEKIGRGAGF